MVRLNYLSVTLVVGRVGIVSMPALALRPGVFIRLKQQSPHVPDFWVAHCGGDRLWIRQLDWPASLCLCVAVTQVAIPTPAPCPAWGPTPDAMTWTHPLAG